MLLALTKNGVYLLNIVAAGSRICHGFYISRKSYFIYKHRHNNAEPLRGIL